MLGLLGEDESVEVARAVGPSVGLMVVVVEVVFAEEM